MDEYYASWEAGLPLMSEHDQAADAAEQIGVPGTALLTVLSDEDAS